jgi:hypothetical protein
LDRDVAAFLDEPALLVGEPLSFRIGHLVAGTRDAGREVEVDPDHRVGVTMAEPGRHERAAVAALRAERRHAEHIDHERVHDVTALVGAEAGLEHGFREPVAGK